MEAWYQQSWKAICGDDWSINDASVVCRMLGFDGALEATESPSNKWQPLFDLRCNGDEEQLQDCDNYGWRHVYCSTHAKTKCNPQHTVHEEG